MPYLLYPFSPTGCKLQESNYKIKATLIVSRMENGVNRFISQRKKMLTHLNLLNHRPLMLLTHKTSHIHVRKAAYLGGISCIWNCIISLYIYISLYIISVYVWNHIISHLHRHKDIKDRDIYLHIRYRCIFNYPHKNQNHWNGWMFTETF